MTDLHKAFSYCPETGELTWQIQQGNKLPGHRAGTISPDGYRCVHLNKKEYLGHRLCWFLHYGEWPKGQIDHINMNRADNRICNLRVATYSQNNLNKRRQSNNTTGHKGVTFNKSTGRYCARLAVNGVRRSLGYYETAAEAASAYHKAAKEACGEFYNAG